MLIMFWRGFYIFVCGQGEDFFLFRLSFANAYIMQQMLSFRIKGKLFQMSRYWVAYPFLSFGSRISVFAIWMSFAVSLSHNCIFFLPVSVSFLHFPLQWHLIDCNDERPEVFFEVLIEMSLLNWSLTFALSEVFWNIRDLKSCTDIGMSELDSLTSLYPPFS